MHFPEKIFEVALRTDDLYGHVYFIKYKSAGTIKIGCTKNIEKRIRTLKKGSNDELELFEQIDSYNYHKIEKTFHKEYQKKRYKSGINFEFFILSEEELNDIRNSKFSAEILNLLTQDIKLADDLAIHLPMFENLNFYVNWKNKAKEQMIELFISNHDIYKIEEVLISLKREIHPNIEEYIKNNSSF